MPTQVAWLFPASGKLHLFPSLCMANRRIRPAFKHNPLVFNRVKIENVSLQGYNSAKNVSLQGVKTTLTTRIVSVEKIKKLPHVTFLSMIRG
jgi:hypothetical protein